MPALRAYAFDATVIDGSIRVDPSLEGHRVRAIVLDESTPNPQEAWLERLMSHRTKITRPFRPLTRDEAHARGSACA